MLARFSVTSPEVPPPDNPVPAETDVISPGFGATQERPVGAALSTERIHPFVDATVRAVGVDADDALTITPFADHTDLSTKFDVSGATTCHTVPVYAFIPGRPVLKYSAPARRGFPSLSTVGSDAFGPRYLSSNESQAASARIADVLAAMALTAAEAAEVDAAI